MRQAVHLSACSCTASDLYCVQSNLHMRNSVLINLCVGTVSGWYCGFSNMRDCPLLPVCGP